jgi:hypothetical protein
MIASAMKLGEALNRFCYAQSSQDMLKINETDAKSNGLRLQIIVFITPFLILAILMYLKEFDHKLYKSAVKEDGLVEYLTAINYFLAFIVGLAITK